MWKGRVPLYAAQITSQLHLQFRTLIKNHLSSVFRGLCLHHWKLGDLGQGKEKCRESMMAVFPTSKSVRDKTDETHSILPSTAKLSFSKGTHREVDWGSMGKKNNLLSYEVTSYCSDGKWAMLCQSCCCRYASTRRGFQEIVPLVSSLDTVGF